MSKSSAWTLADLDLGARRAAEDAAGREGVSLEDWLNEAIEERAISSSPHYRGRETDTRLGRGFRRRRDEAFFLESGRGQSEPEPDWAAAIESLSRRIALGERRSQRAFEFIAIALERTQRTGSETSPMPPLKSSGEETAAAPEMRAARSAGPRKSRRRPLRLRPYTRWASESRPRRSRHPPPDRASRPRTNLRRTRRFATPWRVPRQADARPERRRVRDRATAPPARRP